MAPTINYKAILEGLRDCLAKAQENSGPDFEEVLDRIRCRMACLLDEDPQQSLEAIVERLKNKWKNDGLL